MKKNLVRLNSYFSRLLGSVHTIDLTNAFLHSGTPVILKTFGNKNPDKIFYVIQQESSGRGLFSLLSSIVQHIKLAENHGFIPVVDLKNFKTVYNDQNPETDLWDKIFRPTFSYGLSEVYQSKNVIFSPSSFPCGAEHNISNSFDLIDIFNRYFKVNEVMDIRIKSEISKLDCDLKICLGVHARGREQRTARGHNFPATLHQLTKNIDYAFEINKYERILVVTEDPDILKYLTNRYGSLITFFNFPRERKNIYDFDEGYRLDHKINLALEVYIETFALSRCQSFTGTISNVSNFAQFMNGGKYSYLKIIQNPKNTNIPVLSGIMWSIRSNLPESFGGFENN